MKHLKNISIAKDLDISLPDASGYPESYSANDIKVSEYIALGEAIKELTKRQSELKEEFKHQGTFSTKHYAVLISEKTVRIAPDRNLLESIYGFDRIKDLLKAPGITELDKAFGKPEVDRLCESNKLIRVDKTVNASKKGGQ